MPRFLSIHLCRSQLTCSAVYAKARTAGSSSSKGSGKSFFRASGLSGLGFAVPYSQTLPPRRQPHAEAARKFATISTFPCNLPPLAASHSSPSWPKRPALRASAEATLLGEVSCPAALPRQCRGWKRSPARRAAPGRGAPGAALARGRRRRCRVYGESHARPESRTPP